jgi:type IV secretion system protein VirB10
MEPRGHASRRGDRRRLARQRCAWPFRHGRRRKELLWERFGAALLFSSLNDAASIAASEVSDADNVTRVPSQASDTILRDTMQIQPVLRINQGAEVGIMVARDFDFSNIYGLRLRRGQ